MNCPRCESTRIASRGPSWFCRDCHKCFQKHPRRISVPTEDRPSCPECGIGSPYLGSKKEGERSYVCKNCGRYYKERPQTKVEIPILEVQEV